jgi:hypothetical protein
MYNNPGSGRMASFLSNIVPGLNWQHKY